MEVFRTDNGRAILGQTFDRSIWTQPALENGMYGWSSDDILLMLFWVCEIESDTW